MSQEQPISQRKTKKKAAASPSKKTTAKAAPKKKAAKDDRFKQLDKFIKQNPAVNLREADLLNGQKTDGLKWKGLEDHREEVLLQLKAYQRLLRILPGDDPLLIKALLKEGIHSAIQIASMPKKKFTAKYLPLFGNDSTAIDDTYQRALVIRSQLLIRHIGKVQNAEPHTKAIANNRSIKK